MDTTVKGEIISIGTELLRGEITDTNAVYIAAQLPLIGIELQRMTTSSDNVKQLAEIFQQALARSSVIVTTGGLGPTQDDLTRDAIALVLGEKQFVDPQLEKDLRNMFVKMGREMPLSNLNQANLIPSAKSLANPRGTAPGWWVEKNGKVIVVMPGPPREMVPMWQNEALPRLKAKFPGGNIMARTVKTFSIHEAKVGELLQEFFETANPITGIYAKPDGIQVRLIAHGISAAKLLDDGEAKLKTILDPYVWGTDDDTLEKIIGEALSSRGKSLATIEDFTGGHLSSIISDSELSSKYYRGGMIVNANLAQGSVKIRAAVVSGEIAEAMAKAIKEKLGADFGLSITAIQQNRGTTQSDIVYIGVADASGTKSWQQQFMLNRNDSKERAAVAALFRIRERLIETK
jgi:nicotinamide-nucleotide amidase